MVYLHILPQTFFYHYDIFVLTPRADCQIFGKHFTLKNKTDQAKKFKVYIDCYKDFFYND